MTNSETVERSPASGSATLPAERSQPVWQSYDQLKAATEPEINWLWHGYLAAGDVTVLTSQLKTGKTTLISVLISKLKKGACLPGCRCGPPRRPYFPRRA